MTASDSALQVLQPGTLLRSSRFFSASCPPSSPAAHSPSLDALLDLRAFAPTSPLLHLSGLSGRDSWLPPTIGLVVPLAPDATTLSLSPEMKEPRRLPEIALACGKPSSHMKEGRKAISAGHEVGVAIFQAPPCAPPPPLPFDLLTTIAAGCRHS